MTKEIETKNSQVFGRAVDIPEGESRKVVFVASTEERDRHGTVVNQKNWHLDSFNLNPITGYQHNVYGADMCNPPNPDDVLGPARAWVENNQLMVEIDFETKDLNPLADKIFRKIKNGTLRAVSVGFSEIGEGKWGEGEESRQGSNPTYYFNGQELLEVSVVNIPSNRQALKKAYRDSTKNAITFLSRYLGDKFTLSQIGQMTVDEVISKINEVDGNERYGAQHNVERKEIENREAETEETRETDVNSEEVEDKKVEGGIKDEANDAEAQRKERAKRLYSLIN